VISKAVTFVTAFFFGAWLPDRSIRFGMRRLGGLRGCLATETHPIALTRQPQSRHSIPISTRAPPPGGIGTVSRIQSLFRHRGRRRALPRFQTRLIAATPVCLRLLARVSAEKPRHRREPRPGPHLIVKGYQCRLDVLKIPIFVCILSVEDRNRGNLRSKTRFSGQRDWSHSATRSGRMSELCEDYLR
jgi:hypothetical protein